MQYRITQVAWKGGLNAEDRTAAPLLVHCIILLQSYVTAFAFQHAFFTGRALCCIFPGESKNCLLQSSPAPRASPHPQPATCSITTHTMHNTASLCSYKAHTISCTARRIFARHNDERRSQSTSRYGSSIPCPITLSL